MEEKYRSWNAQLKKMTYFTLTELFNEGQLIWDLGEESSEFIAPHCKRMEFIGLPDKNGKEIYEGDLCRIDGKTYEVYWNDDRWGLQEPVPLYGSKFKYDYENGDYYQPNEIDWNECEIIGNVYETHDILRNPEQ